MTPTMIELDETTLATVAGGAVYEDQALAEDDGGVWVQAPDGTRLKYFPVSGASAGIASWYLINGIWIYR